MRSEAERWVRDADYDLQSAEAMLKAGRYFFVIFMCHLTVEKLFKAAIIEQHAVEPPRIHGLVALETRSGIKVTPKYRDLIDDLDDKSVLTRYPEGRDKIAAALTTAETERILNRTKEFAEWLKQTLTSKSSLDSMPIP